MQIQADKKCRFDFFPSNLQEGCVELVTINGRLLSLMDNPQASRGLLVLLSTVLGIHWQLIQQIFETASQKAQKNFEDSWNVSFKED